MKQKINKEITNEYNLGASVHIQMQRNGSRVHLDVSALYHCIHIDSRHGGCRPNRQTISKKNRKILYSAISIPISFAWDNGMTLTQYYPMIWSNNFWTMTRCRSRTSSVGICDLFIIMFSAKIWDRKTHSMQGLQCLRHLGYINSMYDCMLYNHPWYVNDSIIPIHPLKKSAGFVLSFTPLPWPARPQSQKITMKLKIQPKILKISIFLIFQCWCLPIWPHKKYFSPLPLTCVPQSSSVATAETTSAVTNKSALTPATTMTNRSNIWNPPMKLLSYNGICPTVHEFYEIILRCIQVFDLFVARMHTQVWYPIL